MTGTVRSIFQTDSVSEIHPSDVGKVSDVKCRFTAIAPPTHFTVGESTAVIPKPTASTVSDRMQWIKYDDCSLFSSDNDTVKMMPNINSALPHAGTYFTHVLQHTTGRMKSKTASNGREDRVYCSSFVTSAFM
jgi:hypothetical protein